MIYLRLYVTLASSFSKILYSIHSHVRQEKRFHGVALVKEQKQIIMAREKNHVEQMQRSFHDVIRLQTSLRRKS